MTEMMMQPGCSVPHLRNEICDRLGCRPFTPSTTVRPGDEVRVTSATGGQKGSKLARFDLIPAEAMWKVAELYGKGAEKYDDHNWRKGYPWHLSLAALERHLYKVKAGEDYDNHEPDCLEGCKEHTEMPHLTSIVFHALGLLTFMDEHPDYDDRYKP